MPTLLNSLRENTLGIALFAVVCAGLIATTHTLTKARITQNQQAEKTRALQAIIPATDLDYSLLDGQITLPVKGLGYKQVQAFQAVKQGQVSAVLLPVITPEGYSGNIHLVVGIEADGTLAGVRVLAHKETPGLGDKIDLKKSDWILGFNQQRMQGPNDPTWAVKRDGGRFDQFTGATITPRAVVQATGDALRFFNHHKAELLTRPATRPASHKESKP